jgi:hypothetical protein
MFLVVSMAVCLAASFMALAAICWNCCVSEPHHCSGSTTPAGVGLAGCFARALRRAAPATPDTVPAAVAAVSATFCTPLTTVSAALSLSALATSPMLKFMPFSVASVIFCTSSAWMVAPSAGSSGPARSARP